MKKLKEPITIENIKRVHAARKDEIKARLKEFESIGRNGSDRVLWEEMVFCFFTGGCSARMGLRSLEAVKPILMSGGLAELTNALLGVHRYPNARARYVIASRIFLQAHCDMKLRKKLYSFRCDHDRRDWIDNEKEIKSLGYKDASQYLRKVEYMVYENLENHVLNNLE